MLLLSGEAGEPETKALSRDKSWTDGVHVTRQCELWRFDGGFHMLLPKLFCGNLGPSSSTHTLKQSSRNCNISLPFLIPQQRGSGAIQ